MPRVTQSLDGIAIERWQGRMSGTFELDDDEINASPLDGISVAVVVVKTRATKVDVTTKGDTVATRWYGVTDFRIVDDELREALIERLNLIGADTLFSAAGLSAPPVRSETTKATVEEPDDEPETDVAAAEPPVQDLDEVRRRQAEARAEREARANKEDGPKVARMVEDPMNPGSDEELGEPPAERETLGSVYDKSNRKDKHLERFMADADA